MIRQSCNFQRLLKAFDFIQVKIRLGHQIIARMIAVVGICCLGAFCDAQLASPAWPKFRGNLTSSGQTLGANTQPTQQWTTGIASTATPSSPITGPDGTVYVGGGSNVYALSGSAGGIQWTFTTAGTVQSTPAIGQNGYIYAASYSSSSSLGNAVYAINAQSGSQVWVFYTDGPVVSSPTVDANGNVVVASLLGSIYYLNGSSGSLLWHSKPTAPTPIAPEGFTSSPAIGATINSIPYMFIGGQSDTLYAINLTNGDVLWTYVLGAGTVSSPAVGSGGEGSVYIGCNDGSLYSFTQQGSLQWTFSTNSAIASSPAIGTNGTVYVASQDHHLYAVNSANGSQEWAFAAQAPINSSPAIGADGTIYVGPDDGNIYAVNSVTGIAEWNFPTANSSSSPAVGVDGTLYVLSGPNIVALQSVHVIRITVNPSTVLCGTNVIGTVVLNEPAPTGGAFITLISSNGAASPPAKIIVPQGQSQALFLIATGGVLSTQVATISAFPGLNMSTPLTITPPQVMSLAIQPSIIPELGLATATVTLNGPAGGPKGAVISVSSSSNRVVLPQNLNPPQQVIVAPGQTSTTFPITTLTVDDLTVANITASYGGGTGSATLTIQPATLTGLSVNPASVAGGYSSTGTVTFNLPAGPSGTVVALQTSNSVAQVPPTVTVPSGATSATFNITTTTVTSQVMAQIIGNLRNVTEYAILTVAPVRLAQVSVAPTAVLGGTNATGTVTLNGAAGKNGITVQLSSNSALATVPPSVTVASGQTTATFTIATQAVSAVQTAVITATQGGQTPTSTFSIEPATPTAVSLAPNYLLGGGSSVGTVTLNGPAGPSGIVVSLTSSSSSATLPASLTIPKGATSGTFTINTTGVNANTTATITATSNAVAQSASLLIVATAVQTMTLSPTTVAGGDACVGTVTLTGPASPSGSVVALSSNSSVASVPQSVNVAPGQLSATFPVSTVPVLQQSYAVITATFNGTVTQGLSIVTPTLASVQVSPSTVAGVTPCTGTITLTGPAASGGVTVTLVSGNKFVTVPKTVPILSGNISASFAIGTKTVSTVTEVKITASSAGITQSTVLTLEPIGVVSVSISPTEVDGGATALGTVKLNGLAPSGGSSVRLSSNLSAIMVPGSVSVAADSDSATFTVKTNGVASQKTGTITATVGKTSAHASLTVDPATLVSISVTPSSVAGGANSVGTVTLSGVAPPSGLPIKLSANSQFVKIPGSVSISGNKMTATFTITTTPVATNTSVTLTATLVSKQVSTNLTLMPPGIASLSFSPSSVTGGKSTTGTVKLTEPAPSGGLTVTLSSLSSFAAVPNTLVIAGGKTSGTFKVQTSSVSAKTSANITASSGSSQQTATLTIT